MSKRSASVQFIFATIFLDAIGIGLLIPVFPDVIRRFNLDPDFVSQYFGYFIAVYALMQFVASPILGALSDRYGRRPVLLLSLLCAGLDYLLMAFAPSLVVLFLGRVIAGLTGASMTVASSYMADVSDDSNRSANFGMIGAAWGLGFILGPAIGGLLGDSGYTAPFVCAAVLNLVNFAFGLFVLPESLPPESRRVVKISNLNPLRSLWRVLQPSPISALVWVYFFMFLAGNSHPSIWTLYTEYKFGWSPREVGLSLSFVGLMGAFSSGYLTRLLIPKLGEFRALWMGTALSAISFLGFGLLPEGWMMYVVVLVSALAGLSVPALQSIVAKQVPSNEQGELQGSLISIGSLATILAPLLYTHLFAAFTGPRAPVELPGAPYVLAAAICLISMAILALRRSAIRA